MRVCVLLTPRCLFLPPSPFCHAPHASLSMFCRLLSFPKCVSLPPLSLFSFSPLWVSYVSFVTLPPPPPTSVILLLPHPLSPLPSLVSSSQLDVCLSPIAILFFSPNQRCVQILKSSRQISMTVRAPPSAASMLNSSAPLHGFGPPPGVPGGSRVAGDLVPPPPGMYPPPPNRQTCSWMDRQGRPASPPYEYGGRRPERRDR